MKVISALALTIVLQASPGLAQQQQQSPDIRQPQRPIIIAPAPTPPRVVAPTRGAPPELLHQAPAPPSGIVIQRPPAAPSDLPGVRHVPSVSSLPGMRQRPIARHVVVSGIGFDIPAIVVVGAPYVIDVPGLGWIYVPEDEYPALFAMLTSDDSAQVEAAYERLKRFASAQ
jgi:hypothetical protein